MDHAGVSLHRDFAGRNAQSGIDFSSQSSPRTHFASPRKTDLNSVVGPSGDYLEMCGLCGIQKAILSMGSCGHRSESLTQPSPDKLQLQQKPLSTLPQSSTQPTVGPPFHQRSHPVAMTPQHIVHGSTQPQNHGQGQQGLSHDIVDGYPYNRQYQSAFVYGHTYTAPLQRTGSGPAEIPETSAPGYCSPAPAYPFFRHGQHGQNFTPQHSNQSSHMRPPTGMYPYQSNQGSFPPSLSKGMNQYAPPFQAGSNTTMQQLYDPSSSNMAMIGRPGTTGAPTSGWRENSSQFAGDYANDRSGLQSHRNKPYQSYNTQPSYCLSAFTILPNLPPAIPPTTPRTEAIRWAVVRVTNIPWDVSLQDMAAFFTGFPTPPEHLLSQNVHILMDRATGKTFNSAFVELALTPVQAGMVAQSKNLKVLKGRVVTVELSSQDELLRSIFPKWIGHFENGEPVLQSAQMPSLDKYIAETRDAQEDSQEQLQQQPGGPCSSTLANVQGASPATPPFVTRDEINALLVVCRNYKLHFSRKCAERPFENILSILAKYPWHQAHRVLPLHRDHIFELLKLSIESLGMHLNKEYSTIHSTLLTRMVRCAILTPAFTERQKAMVLHVAGCPCPEDLVSWMSPPTPTTTTTITADTDSLNLSETTTAEGSDDGTAATVSDSSSKASSTSSSSSSLTFEDKDEQDECGSLTDLEEHVDDLDISKVQCVENENIHKNATPLSWASIAAPATLKQDVTLTESDSAISISCKDETIDVPSTTAVAAAAVPSYASALVQPACATRSTSRALHGRGQSLGWCDVATLASSSANDGNNGGADRICSADSTTNEKKGKDQHLTSPVEYRSEDQGTHPDFQPNCNNNNNTHNTNSTNNNSVPGATTSLTQLGPRSSSMFQFPMLANSNHRRASLPRTSLSRSCPIAEATTTTTTTMMNLDTVATTTPTTATNLSNSISLTSVNNGSGGGVSKSGSTGSILEAIKTITQSTPRLTKSSSMTSPAGIRILAQCREGGETL
ncbi:hypothetical protein BG004_007795 [Podila humilis]|nr:hypothetical protein BG004_007795 [Podila humilis]